MWPTTTHQVMVLCLNLALKTSYLCLASWDTKLWSFLGFLISSSADFAWVRRLITRLSRFCRGGPEPRLKIRRITSKCLCPWQRLRNPKESTRARCFFNRDHAKTGSMLLGVVHRQVGHTRFKSTTRKIKTCMLYSIIYVCALLKRLYIFSKGAILYHLTTVCTVCLSEKLSFFTTRELFCKGVATICDLSSAFSCIEAIMAWCPFPLDQRLLIVHSGGMSLAQHHRPKLHEREEVYVKSTSNSVGAIWHSSIWF